MHVIVAPLSVGESNGHMIDRVHLGPLSRKRLQILTRLQWSTYKNGTWSIKWSRSR